MRALNWGAGTDPDRMRPLLLRCTGLTLLYLARDLWPWDMAQ
jgi:hypothetical protein